VKTCVQYSLSLSNLCCAVSVCQAISELREDLVSLAYDAFERPQLGLMCVARLRLSSSHLLSPRSRSVRGNTRYHHRNHC